MATETETDPQPDRCPHGRPQGVISGYGCFQCHTDPAIGGCTNRLCIAHAERQQLADLLDGA